MEVERIPIGRAARVMGVTVSTLRRWDRLGTLRAERTPSGRRVYRVDALNRALGRRRQGTRASA